MFLSWKFLGFCQLHFLCLSKLSWDIYSFLLWYITLIHFQLLNPSCILGMDIHLKNLNNTIMFIWIYKFFCIGDFFLKIEISIVELLNYHQFINTLMFLINRNMYNHEDKFQKYICCCQRRWQFSSLFARITKYMWKYRDF